MMKFLRIPFLLLALFACVSYSLNILLILPCYGGHYGSMHSIIQMLAESSSHKMTVIETSTPCHKKLLSVKEKYPIEVIQDFVGGDGEMEINGMVDFFLNLGTNSKKGSKMMTDFTKKFLEQRANEFDLIITDMTFDGVLIAAEIFNKPVVVSIPGFSPGVENSDEQHGLSLMEAFFFRLALGSYLTYLEDVRSQLGLPQLVSQGDLFPFEYVSRFPALIYTSPSFFPTPHPSMDYLFIGGYRGNNQSEQESLSAELSDWLDGDERDVVYVSMGTNLKVDNSAILHFVEQVRNQRRYRVIWSLSVGMQKAVFDQLQLTSDPTLLFSKFLPQYTLLGHPKVRVFVTHGGLLSSVDVIKQGKPSVCVPHIADQFYNCRKMNSWGSSETASSFNFENINGATVKILDNYAKYFTQASQYKEDFSNYEDADALSAFLEKIAARKQVSIVKDFGFQLSSDRAIRSWKILKISVFAVPLGLMCLILLCCYRRKWSKKENAGTKPKSS